MQPRVHRRLGLAATWIASLALVLLAAGAQTPGLVLFGLAGAGAFGFALTFAPPQSSEGGDDDGRRDDHPPDDDGGGPDWAAFDDARRQWSARPDRTHA